MVANFSLPAVRWPAQEAFGVPQAPLFFEPRPPRFESALVEVAQTGPFDGGCGGPSYRWTDDGHIEIGGVIPKKRLPPKVASWKSLAAKYAEKYGLPTHYVLGYMALESGGNEKAGSPAGAMGLMQLIQSTADSLAGRHLSKDEVFDPETNLDLGCKLIARNLEKYHDDPIKSAFAYNAGRVKCGAGCVRDYKAQGSPCIEPCDPNQFNLFADCSPATHVTVDYGGLVAAFSNEALDEGLTGYETPPEPPPTEASSSSHTGAILLGLGAVALSIGGVVLYRKHARAA